MAKKKAVARQMTATERAIREREQRTRDARIARQAKAEPKAAE